MRPSFSLRLFAISLMLGHAAVSPTLATCQLGRNVPYGSNSATPRRDWDYDGKRILGHIGADIYLWDATTGKILQKFSGHRESPHSLRFSPDAKYILSSSGVRTNGDFPPDCTSVDTSTRLWDAASGRQLWEKSNVFGAAFSLDSKRILMLSLRDCNDSPAVITMWDIHGKKLFDAEETPFLYRSNTFSAVYTRVAFSLDGHRFLSESYDNEASLYDADTGKEIRKFEDANAIHFYGDRGDVETSSSRGVDIWSASGRFLRRIPLKGEYGLQGVWSSDGSYMADIRITNFSTWKGVMRLWDVKSGHTTSVGVSGHSLTPSPTGTIGLVWKGGGAANSGYTPLQFAMYDLINGQELWDGQEEAYSFLGFSPDGKTFLVGGGPNFVVYSTKTGEALSNVDLLGTCQKGNGLGGFAEPHPDCVPGGTQ